MKNFFIDDKNAKEYISRIGDFIQDEVGAANKDGIVLGASGGVDSSVAARLCQEADVKIKLFTMQKGDDMVVSRDLEDALELMKQFKFDYQNVDITKSCEAIEADAENITTLDPLDRLNIKARVISNSLYIMARKLKSLVMGTTNLDERLLGYFPRCAVGPGDINPLGLLTKGEVQTLARHLDVPNSIINKPSNSGLCQSITCSLERDFGFGYDAMDNYILRGTSGNKEVDEKIAKRIALVKGKLNLSPIFTGVRQKERENGNGIS